MTSKLSQDKLRQALQPIIDPELHVSIIDLGLVYDITSDEKGSVRVCMTLTTPTCPLHEHFVKAVESALKSVPGVKSVSVTFTFDPPWSLAKATESAKNQLAVQGIPLPW